MRRKILKNAKFSHEDRRRKKVEKINYLLVYSNLQANAEIYIKS